jgi:phage shock protein A
MENMDRKIDSLKEEWSLKHESALSSANQYIDSKVVVLESQIESKLNRIAASTKQLDDSVARLDGMTKIISYKVQDFTTAIDGECL